MNTVLMFFTVVALTGTPVTPTSQIPALDEKDCQHLLKAVAAVNKYSIQPGYVMLGSCEKVRK